MLLSVVGILCFLLGLGLTGENGRRRIKKLKLASASQRLTTGGTAPYRSPEEETSIDAGWSVDLIKLVDLLDCDDFHSALRFREKERLLEEKRAQLREEEKSLHSAKSRVERK